MEIAMLILAIMSTLAARASAIGVFIAKSEVKKLQIQINGNVERHIIRKD